MIVLLIVSMRFIIELDYSRLLEYEARSLTGVPSLVQRWYGLFSPRYPGLLVTCVQKDKKKRLHQTLVTKYAQEAL